MITGCGSSKDAGKVAVRTIEDDWEGFFVASSDPFPARPDLKGLDTIRSIHCGDKKQRGAGTLTLHARRRPQRARRRGEDRARARALRRAGRAAPVEVHRVARAAAPPPQLAWPARRPRRRGHVLDRLRQRRLVDLLRARRHGALRRGDDARHVRDLGRDLRVHGRDLCRGDGALPGGRRLGVVLAPRVQRGGLVLRRLGADAQLHGHDRDLGVHRAALPLGVPRLRLHAQRAHGPGRRRCRALRRARAAQHPRHPGVGAAQHLPRDRRPRDAGAARGRRRRADPGSAGARRATCTSARRRRSRRS